ncbi:unnamed protein product [Amoebophrya sp. A25]|nr:unnamed protein product [Amoebophrya sp. A25]|eukprot:GSA25T00018258001.1
MASADEAAGAGSGAQLLPPAPQNGPAQASNALSASVTTKRSPGYVGSTALPGANSKKMLPYVSFGRVSDYSILAACGDSTPECDAIFSKLLQAAKWKMAPGKRLRLQWSAGAVCCLLDGRGEILYILVTATVEYPERLAFQLLNTVADFVQDYLPPEQLNTLPPFVDNGAISACPRHSA